MMIAAPAINHLFDSKFSLLIVPPKYLFEQPQTADCLIPGPVSQTSGLLS
jgi:hypothetical protein